MKILAERAHLLAALQAVAHLADGKSKIPAIGHVLLRRAGPGRLVVIATDLDTCAEAEIPAEVEPGDGIGLRAEELVRLVRGLPEGGQIAIDVDDAQAKIRSGRSRYTLPIWPGSDFPALFEAGEKAARFYLAGGEVERLFAGIEAALPEEKQIDLGPMVGIFLHADGNVLRTVATDGKMFIAAPIECPPGAEALPESKITGLRGIVIPRWTAKHLVKLGEAGLDISADRNIITISSRGNLAVRLSSKLLGGDYPDYRLVIPPAEGPFIEVEGAAFLGAITRLRDAAIEGGRGVGIEWDAEGDLALWLDRSVALTEGAERVEILARESSCRVGAQAALLAKMTAAVGPGRLRIMNTSPAKPLRLINLNDPEYVAILFSLNLRARPAGGS